MKLNISITRNIEVNYEIEKTNGIEMITVEIPKIGKKSAHTDGIPIENLIRILVNDILNEIGW